MSNEHDACGGIAKPYLSKEQLELLEAGYRAIPDKCQKLCGDFLTRTYNDARAQEYALHGFSRRMNTLARCIRNTFEILPPSLVGLPTREQLSDTAINIQAFVFNVFGSLDNLAWIWVSEKDLRKKDGSQFPKARVGLGNGNTDVRGTFSPEFQAYLRELDGWFDHLEDFRHALAHRIPLYIPPYVVSKANEAAYRELQDRMNAAMTRRDFAAYGRLSAEQDALGAFRPWVTHSVGEQPADPVMLHSQLLCDFATVEAVAQKLLAELDR
jgi:hypothetical protein